METAATLDLYAQLKRFIYSKVKNKQDAEDIVQDVFVRAQQKMLQLKDREKVTGWMYTVTRHSIVDYYRAKKKNMEQIPEASTEEYNLFNDCVAHCILQIIQSLPEPYRQALLLTEQSRVSQKELAERLNISYSGAKSRVQRGRQMVKQKMEALYHIKTDGFGNVLVCEDRLPCCNDTNLVL